MENKVKLMEKLLRGAVKVEHGFYASTQIDFVTVGVSVYPFKKAVSVFTALKTDADTKKIREILFPDVTPSLVSIKKTTMENDLSKLNFFLVKYERKTEVLEEEDIRTIEAFNKLKQELKEYLVKPEEFKPFSFSLSRLNEVKDVPLSLLKLEEVSFKHNLKFVVSLTQDYSYSCVISPEEAYLRRKIMANYSGFKGITFSYPSGGALLIKDRAVFVVKPFYEHESFHEAVKSLYSARIDTLPPQITTASKQKGTPEKGDLR